MTSSFASNGFPNMSWDKIQNAFASKSELTKPVVQHLQRVYLTLLGGSICAAAGSYVYMQTHVNHMLPFFVSLGCMFMLSSTPKNQVEKRLGFFGLIAFCQGLSVGGSIQHGRQR